VLADDPATIAAKVRTMVTDPQKIRKGDPGRPEICNVFTYHNRFNTAEVPQIDRDCRSGALGCVDCKKNLANKISDFFAPHREKRTYYESHLDEVKDILHDGEKRARETAQQTMGEVRQAMKLGVLE
jgi:tryptophanyl-tRNA synthetase